VTAAAHDRFPRRAGMVLFIFVFLQLLGFAVTLIAPGPPELRIALLVWLSITVVFLVWLARNVLAARPWARPVAIVTLWSFAFTGAVETVVALGQNRINIPIGTLVALFALSVAGPFRLPDDPEERQRAIFTSSVALVMFIVPPLVGVFGLRM
jgi:hypothetical protein